MNPTITPMRTRHWVGFVAVLAAATVGLAACGDDDDGVGESISDPTWTVTTDPYGREWACLYVDGWSASAMFCAPAPGEGG